MPPLHLTIHSAHRRKPTILNGAGQLNTVGELVGSDANSGLKLLQRVD